MKKKKYVFLIILLVFIFIFSGVSILFFNNNGIQKNNNTATYLDWMTYIMNTNINSIQINYCLEEEYIETADGNVIQKKDVITITNDDLNMIFLEMKKGTITKEYYGGIGAFCLPSIDINYTSSNKQTYTLQLVMNRYINVSKAESDKILAFLETTDYTVKILDENMDITNEPYMFKYSYDESIIVTLIDKYSLNK